MRHGNRDTTHKAIVAALRAVGVSVFDTADVAGGFPDLVCGFRGQTYLLEVKGPKGKLRVTQAVFAALWRGGPTVVVRSPAEALAMVGLAEVGAQMAAQLEAKLTRQRLRAPARPRGAGGPPAA